MITNTQSLTKDTRAKSGFTLIEVIAVLVLLGILTAIALPRYIDMAENARERAIDAGISELNGRESLVWGNILISQAGYDDDDALWLRMAATEGGNILGNGLGADYTWDEAPTATGGTLIFQNNDPGVGLTRTPSSADSPGVWRRTN